MEGGAMNNCADTLEGSICAGLIVESFDIGDQVASPANVTFIKVGETWHRLALDAGTVHWRKQLQDPVPWEVREEGWRYPHTNLGDTEQLIGEVITRVSATPRASGCRVEVHFGSGRVLVLEEVDDVVRYAVVPRVR